VGAFWRANETGERLIRIDAGDNAATNGTWTATLVWMDARWGFDDGVLLDTEMLSTSDLTARGISFSSNMNPDTYGTPEQYPVTDATASGNANSTDNYIFFRIGLKTKYTPTVDHPARYAVVLLSYNNNSKHQKIFLRQGENPDYLMMPNDPVAPESHISTRTISKKFAVFNLTATTLDNKTKAALRGAIFTDYPTKAGAFWQWGVDNDNNFSRVPFKPWVAPDPSTDAWSGNYNTQKYWSGLEVYTEVSPAMPVGFRRPNDGHTNQHEPCSKASIANSEFRQSLYWKVLSEYNYASELGNSIWGYYADGFFDRRMISTSPGMEKNEKTTVADGGKDIAYIGRLYFNPIGASERFNASLFFPAAGWLYPSPEGVLKYAGADGVYWSSSANDEGATTANNAYCGLGIIVRENHAGMWREAKVTGATIRPVVE
jgi:hypothetical protein